ncbi:GIY-YIG nuclease family protein [Candidatus Saccharibacteria bacterium]|nr:GIY-YIG nuclease family protein [Candidatus Saccharibacteria bacterium]
MYIVYVLHSSQLGSRYIGQTSNLSKRLSDHNSGESKYTKGKGHWELVYEEHFDTRAEAMRREKYLKTGKGRDFLSNLGK